MKLNSTVVLTLILLFLMVGAGVTSATWGYRLGRESLKGVTQPNSRPINRDSTQAGHARGEGLVLLKEDDILTNVKAQIDGNGGSPAN